MWRRLIEPDQRQKKEFYWLCSAKHCTAVCSVPEHTAGLGRELGKKKGKLMDCDNDSLIGQKMKGK